MSGNPEDLFDDDPRQNAERFRKAKAALGIPATLLIVNGALGLLLAILGIVQLSSLPKQFDQMIAQVENDKKIPQDQKDQQIEIYTKCKEWAEEQTPFLIFYGIIIVSSCVVILGGIMMFRLSGPGIPMLSSVISIIPGTVGACCCCLGFPAGIWAFVVLCRPDVRAAMSRRGADQFTDDLESPREYNEREPE
jgi:hypothetical protein